MQRTHKQEKKQFEKLFKQEHVDNFEDRFKVLETFLQTEKHVTSAELTQMLNERGYDLDNEFVRDTLKLMCNFGFARKNKFDNGIVRYEHWHLGQHHDHLICIKCRKIVEFEEDSLENLQISIASKHGFHLLQHRMELYGICSACMKERVKLMPLSDAKQGERLIVRNIMGGTGARMRLLAMGIRPEDEIDVITNISRGQLVIAIEQKRFVIGQGLAQKIIVEPVER
ncbi:MAG: Fur family transcriptional regulator [Desulfobacteraceae bacterium]|nr:MAG: Fur family transcriptional regulator [Desulfobacteraceae bacterium]